VVVVEVVVGSVVVDAVVVVVVVGGGVASTATSIQTIPAFHCKIMLTMKKLFETVKLHYCSKWKLYSVPVATH
jgi:hypothetical protein